jgi:potassium-transporting ATPase KdpC subunit
MKTLIISIKIFLFLTLITGIIYPLIITGIAQVAFPEKANGSLLFKDNKLIGSKLIGQQFDSCVYFASRPSAVFYNPLPSEGSNLALSSMKLKYLVAARKRQFIVCNQLDSLAEIPSEMLFASASGLDPHISVEAALLQVTRIAETRNLNEIQKKKLVRLVNSLNEKPQFGILGEYRLNALLLNIKTDSLSVN